MPKMVMITGGGGYIGAHACIELLNNDYEVIIADNKPLSKLNILNRKIYKITGKYALLEKINFNSKKKIKELFSKFNIDLVIHLAGIKQVSHFYSNPLESFQNDLLITVNLLSIMEEYQVKKIIFASSVLVYDNDNQMPLTETSKVSLVSPYARCKVFTETLLSDLYQKNDGWNYIVLRFFNTVGIHTSGLIDEFSNHKPNNLFNSIVMALKNLEFKIKIFGNNYNTKDGSCERDFIHVSDVANGICLSADSLLNKLSKTPLILNLCSGQKYSVFEILSAFEKTFQQKINYEIIQDRIGDVAVSYGDNNLAKKQLGWQPMFNIDDVAQDLYNLYIKKSTLDF